MGQAYRIDRISLITYKNQKKKQIYNLRCRYIAKSQFVKCTAKNGKFSYVNFRGARLKQVCFDGAKFDGCDFWGTTFNGCSFVNAKIQDCVFMACKFHNCKFAGADFTYSTIVNTNISDCNGINIGSGVNFLKSFPQCVKDKQLSDALETLSVDHNLRKAKIFQISNKKYNELNLYLLHQKFSSDELPNLLRRLEIGSTTNLTTYKKVERQLKCIQKSVII